LDLKKWLLGDKHFFTIEEILLFQEVLQKYDYIVTIRQSTGREIGVDCGQVDGKPKKKELVWLP
jgi:adenine C2-methylase RlmN of 23S rRNA A2503 and tRNA A37